MVKYHRTVVSGLQKSAIFLIMWMKTASMLCSYTNSLMAQILRSYTEVNLTLNLNVIAKDTGLDIFLDIQTSEYNLSLIVCLCTL